MTITVDLVVAGADDEAIQTIVAAARSGRKVLVVIGSPHPAVGRRLRRALRTSHPDVRRHVSVMSGAQIVCSDGVAGIEAIVIRRIKTGRLIGVNASAIDSRASGQATRSPTQLRA